MTSYRDRENEIARLKAHRFTRRKDVFAKLLKWLPGRPSMITEGDSWFAYPPQSIFYGRGSNVIDHIQRKRRFSLLRLEANGDEAVAILAGKQIHNLAALLNRHRGKIDILLFSGGGNDIVGKWNMESLLKKWKPGMKPRDAIRNDRFRRKLKQIEIAYMSLIALRDDYCADCVIITHGYDYPIPSDSGASFLWGLVNTKPWMKPYMDKKGIPAGNAQEAIAKHMIKRFGETIQAIARNPTFEKGFRFVNTPGTLTRNGWLNEIHPTKKGFGKIADKIYPEIERVLRSKGKI